MLPERVRAIASIGDVATRDLGAHHETPTRTRAATVSAAARSRRMSLGWDVSGLTGRTIQVLDTRLEET